MAGDCEVMRTGHEDDEDIGEGLLDIFKVREIVIQQRIDGRINV
jgi:hypothetical protein